MTQIAQRNNHVLQMLKRLKETLENDKKKYADKVNVLVMTWERIAASAREQRPLAAICIVEKMYKDTLSIMLQGEWPKMSPVSKTHLMQMLNRCRTDLCKEMPWLNCKFRKLLELVNDPWTLPSLKRILHRDPSPATPEQIVEFCISERGLLIVTRLTMLCSSRCEKIAIKLAEACFGALIGEDPSLLTLFTSTEYNFIFDIYLCLLYKYKKLEFIINALKTRSVEEGYHLVCRLRRRSNFHEQKIWKFSHQVAAMAAKYFVTISMLSRTVPNPTLLKNLISEWLSMCKPGENNIENEIRKVMQPAETSEHIYIIAEVLTALSQKLRNQMYSSLIMELYIRALTADINYLERVKLQNDKEAMTAYEKHLASKFLALADLVKDHSGVRREFVLTAFSIHPSAENYRRVEEEAMASGKTSPHSTSQESIEVGVLSEGLSSLSSEETEGKDTVTDYTVNNDSQDSGAFVEISNRCSLHLPYDGVGPEGELCFQCGDFTGTQTSQIAPESQQKKKERSLDALILIKGSTVTESLNYDVLSAPSQVLEAEKLGLTSQVCADLVTLLGSNRYHLLTWVLEWGELSSRCLRYMDEADTIKSGKKELKFLEIDYNQYKDWPENEDDEADCIEKGYEHWLEDNTETDFDTDSKRSNTDDSEELMIKTALRRSQKQMGRYAESSSDSEDSRRSRPRNRKRGRPRKRLKSYSDSGSVSDSLGSDGQKQKSSNKKKTKTKDLRKTLGRLKYLEMVSDSNNVSPTNDSFLSDTVNGKEYCLPQSAVGPRSDPTVLKSLRAFRPNAHKPSKNDFIQSVTENCYNSKMVSGKTDSNKKSAVFDCNDNKFISKKERYAFSTNDMELHFKTDGVRTKKYNDVIRTIKEDLISVSNIPSVANNATVNVVHVHDSQKLNESLESADTSRAGGRQTTTTQTSSASSASSATPRNANTLPVQKSKQENESSGSQARKSTSSQPSSQNVLINYSDSVATTTASILSSSLMRVVPAGSKTGATFAGGNQVLSTVAVKPGGSKMVGQPQYMAIVNRNSLSQANNLSGQTSNSDSQSAVSGAVVGIMAANSIKTTGQNFITQAANTTVQPARVVTVPATDTSRFAKEGERPNVILSKNLGMQNVRAAAPLLFNHITQELSNGGGQAKKAGEYSGSAARPGANAADNSDQGNVRLSFENALQSSASPKKLTIISTKQGDLQKVAANEVGNVTSGGGTAPANLLNKSISVSKSSANAAVFANQTSPQLAKANNNPKTPHTVILQTSVPVTGRNSTFVDASGTKRSFSLVKAQGASGEIIAGTPLTFELRNVSSAATTGGAATAGAITNTTAAVLGTRNYGSANIAVNKAPYNEVVQIVQGMTGLSQGGSAIDVSETSASASATNPTSGGETGEVIAIIDPSSNLKLDSASATGRNLLATVLKRNSVGTLLAPSTSSTAQQFTIQNSRNLSGSQGDGVQNVMISQSSSSSTIHYTVVNPVQQDSSGNSQAGDSIERGIKQSNFESQIILPSLLNPIEGSLEFANNAGTAVKNATTTLKNVEKSASPEGATNPLIQQASNADGKKIIKPSSSPLTVQSESGFIKKQVLNNQKITILVQNSEDVGNRVENQPKSKLNELLLRDDQKTCIAFRAIKRTPSEGNQGEPSLKKKCSYEGSGDNDQNGNEGGVVEKELSSESASESNAKSQSNLSESSMCQYLVLEAINDPVGALPKFNQAFGKSYQVKIPQAVKAADSGETSPGTAQETLFAASGPAKADASKISVNESTSATPSSSAAHSSNQVPVTEAPKELNTFEIVQKPVKSVYIDKEVKVNVQSQSAKTAQTESANISTIQMTEVQRPGVATYQALPKAGGSRSSVVQQLLRKVPATGPPTLQAVNSVNTLTAKPVKSQEVVPGSTLIYTTETRPQPQIVIQRAVGRVGAPAISQMAPVIYTQGQSDHGTPQTQTLLLAAVPAGTRGMAPGTQLLRIPSSSGVWKMTSSANPPRIVQLRPQNLVLQGGQDQGLLMQSGQSVLLHHLTSLPVKPIGVVANSTKTEQAAKMDAKSDMFNKPEMSLDDSKICSVALDVDQAAVKSETTSSAATASEHETVSLMKDIKEFENVFEETKLKFEMEEQQSGCLPEVEAMPQAKPPLAAVNVQPGTPATQPVQQTVLVQPQLMLHKPQMIITSALPNQQAIFTQKIDKQLSLDKEPEKRLILTTKPKLAGDESSPSQHIAVAYVNHSTPSSISVQKPLVVVTNYTQPPTSPAPSLASQNSSSPSSVVSSVSFTSGSGNSSGKTPAKGKSRGIKTVLNSSKSPPAAKPQQKPQEDANTAQKIYAILEEYAVQLRNSPDMNNRPAPRRRSNPPANSSSKRKKTVCKSKESFSDGDETNFVEDNGETLANNEENPSGGVTVLQVCVSSSH